MPQSQIAFVTCERMMTLLADDQILFDELDRKGLNPNLLAWTSQTDWSQYPLTLIRAPWDYIDAFDAFMEWIEGTASVTSLYNSASILKWNADKQYLKELETKGVPTIPTIWVPQQSTCSLAKVIEERGWHEMVVKPCIASGSRGALRVSQKNLNESQAHLETALITNDMMIQPYLSSIEDKGEISLIYFGGRYSHAVQRLAAIKDGTFTARAKSVHHAHQATPDERAIGELVLKNLPDAALYARMDLIRDDHNHPMIIEAELIEPMLFFSFDDKAAARFADVIEQKLIAT